MCTSDIFAVRSCLSTLFRDPSFAADHLICSLNIFILTGASYSDSHYCCVNRLQDTCWYTDEGCGHTLPLHKITCGESETYCTNLCELL